MLSKTISKELPGPDSSSTKRQVTPFLYIDSHPYGPTLMQGFGMRTAAKRSRIIFLKGIVFSYFRGSEKIVCPINQTVNGGIIRFEQIILTYFLTMTLPLA